MSKTAAAIEHTHAKATAPKRSGWTTHSIHRCPNCKGIARLGMTRTGATVPTGDVLTDRTNYAYYGAPTGWNETVTPGGLVAVSADHSHLDPVRSWYGNGRTCLYEAWTTDRGSIPTIDHLVDEWCYPVRSYWDKADTLRFESTIVDFDLAAFIAGGYGVRATDERGGPAVLLTLARPVAIYKLDTGRLPASYAEAQGHQPKKDWAKMRDAFLAEISATMKPRRR